MATAIELLKEANLEIARLKKENKELKKELEKLKEGK